MSNVTILLAGNQTTDEGCIFVKGPATWVIKDFDWLFDANGTLTVDCVTLWKDGAGADTIGEISFTDSNLFSSVSSGTIKCVGEAGTEILS